MRACFIWVHAVARRKPIGIFSIPTTLPIASIVDLVRASSEPLPVCLECRDLWRWVPWFDDRTPPSQLQPLNLYAKSKNMFDQWVLEEIAAGRPEPRSWAGLQVF